MSLLKGHMRFARSAVMADIANGGGPPTSQLLPDGASNAVFPDISEDARTAGLVEIRQLHAVLRNTDTAPLLGGNIIIAEPPNDDGVGMVMLKTGTFHRRPDIVKLMEATSTPGGEFNGFLLGNHVESVRSVRIGQRPGLEPPGVNTSLVLVLNEGLPSQVLQFVRVRRVTVTQEVFTESTPGGGYVDYPIQVATCEIYSPLEFDFAGSEANRFYGKQAGKAMIRRVFFTDAGTFYGASRLTEACEPTDMELRIATVYAQIVPNTRTETPLLDQRPGGQRTVQLVDSYGTLEVSASAHTDRLMITEATQGFAHVFKLTPPPAPNSIALSYLALNEWQTIIDDGAGALGSGPGSGNVLYPTGDLAATLQALPDYNTPIIVSWADTAPYINQVPTGPVSITTRPPEFELETTPGSNVDGAEITWESGDIARLATANAAGVLSGDATGLMSSALGRAFIRPAHMPDAGTNFTIEYASRPTVTDSFASVSVDGGGYAALSLSDEPVPGTATVRWITAQNVSASSGADLSGTSSATTVADLPGAWSAPAISGLPGTAPAWRTTKSNSSYTKRTESSSSSRLVVAHALTDDGAGGWGGEATLGNINYAGQTISLRMVTQGASVNSYRSDHESASSFRDSSLVMSVRVG
ncbi:MAG: hypothetical protein ACK40L_08825 [Hydrogenophaga sp.]